jgi:hypothetical protein
MALKGRGTTFDHTRYSHRHETYDNPAGVWTFSKLMRERALYAGVLLSLRSTE